MKIYITLILFFSIIISAWAQDSTVHLSPKMFDKNQSIDLFALDGWRFHEGHNTTWAGPAISTDGWKKMKPLEVSKKMADKSGKIEGWFRLRMWVDSSFGNMSLYLSTYCRGAEDTYVDGNLFESYGDTGIDGNGYNAPGRNGKRQLHPIRLATGKEHTLSIHFVNYLPPFPLNLITTDDVLSVAPSLSGPAFEVSTNAYYERSALYESIAITVCVVLSLLFWLLAFQNPGEPNLRLIALCPTCFAVGQWLLYILQNGSLSLAGFSTINAFVLFFSSSWILLTPLILAKIFTNKMPRKLIIFLSVVFIGFCYFRLYFSLIPILIILLIIAIICLYYVISSWKIVKGAQWAIVAGVMTTFLLVIMYSIWVLAGGFSTLTINEAIIDMVIYLSFPLSLLVYVSLRFREIISDVRENARQVMQVTEEKRQQALNQQKVLEQEVKRQTADLTETLQNLKSTQAQLIQAEKMASLGELTAGIAHEIQNPLNFVNNFSEVNRELITDLKTEIKKGNIEEVNTIADDIESNEEKINHHGKRADAIVKGMLQHSRASKGLKEPADINALADEYLRLSYHGLRAKDKDFNVTIETHFDESIGKIEVIPQDIGRVLLNLFNNAFYAVKPPNPLKGENYTPTVSVSTKRISSPSGAAGLIITVKDNGVGIPQKIVDKIFQPFFTTKPTGQGTGLGLSLSYDIIKAHGGEIRVESSEGEGSVFVVLLPLNNIQ